MLTFADELEAIVRLDAEGDAAPANLGALGIDRHRLPRHGRGNVRGYAGRIVRSRRY